MAWNGSRQRCSTKTAGPVPKAAPKADSCRRRWARAATALLVLGVLGLLLGRAFAPGGAPVAARPVPWTGISDAPSAPRSNPPPGPVPGLAAAEAKSDAPGKSARPKTYRDARGVLRYEGGARVPGQRPLARPIDLGSRRPKIFRHAAEEHISWLLEMKVGEPVVGDYAYGDAFRRSFRESLDERVEILDTDDARTRELKTAVQETKEELRRRMESGEDVAEVMNDAMDEFRRLARYRQELQSQLREIRADGERYSDQDVEDFTRAANEMLRREGLPPLAMPRALMRGLERR